MEVSKTINIDSNKKYFANPSIVLREESDDWALLFDPDSGATFSLNPVGVFVWKQLNGENSIKDIIEKVHESCINIADDVENHIKTFIKELLAKGLASDA
jgi:SynChlorMet cassette protein ScmD